MKLTLLCVAFLCSGLISHAQESTKIEKGKTVRTVSLLKPEVSVKDTKTKNVVRPTTKYKKKQIILAEPKKIKNSPKNTIK